MKLLFAASSGGHFEQIMMLKPLMEKYDSVLLTEKTEYGMGDNGIRTIYVPQINRKGITFLPKLIANTFRAIKIYHKEKPDIMITTGVLAIVPLALIVKMHRRKLVYIESFAKITSKTLSGKLLYKFADQFYVQWKSMLKLYPKAIYKGGIY